MELLNPYALLDGKVVYVDSVPSGKRCGCLCPRCHTPFIARKGPQRIHHFSHEIECGCWGGLESAVHLLCKQKIEEKGKIRLPHPDRKEAANYVEFDRVEVEKPISKIRPDLIAYRGDNRLIIEIHVWHKTEPSKIAMIEKLGISAVEISLTEFRHPETRPDLDLERSLIEDVSNKKWLFNRTRKLRSNGEKPTRALTRRDDPRPYVFPNNYICRICRRNIGPTGWAEHDVANGSYVCRDCIGTEDYQKQ